MGGALLSYGSHLVLKVPSKWPQLLHVVYLRRVVFCARKLKGQLILMGLLRTYVYRRHASATRGDLWGLGQSAALLFLLYLACKFHSWSGQEGGGGGVFRPLDPPPPPPPPPPGCVLRVFACVCLRAFVCMCVSACVCDFDSMLCVCVCGMCVLVCVCPCMFVCVYECTRVQDITLMLKLCIQLSN